MKDLLSKETHKLERQFHASFVKDMEALVGKCFMAITPLDEDDVDEDGDTEMMTEFSLVEELRVEDDVTTLVGTTVSFDTTDQSYVEIAVGVDLDGIAGQPCSRHEFYEAMARGQRLVAKKLDSLKEKK